MILAALAVAAVAVAVLGFCLVAVLRQARVEREAWAEERRALTDRVIARHTGEVIAFDRAAQPKAEREYERPQFIEGLS